MYFEEGCVALAIPICIEDMELSLLELEGINETQIYALVEDEATKKMKT